MESKPFCKNIIYRKKDLNKTMIMMPIMNISIMFGDSDTTKTCKNITVTDSFLVFVENLTFKI